MVKPSKYYKGTRNEVVQFLPQSYSKVLEIGCGKGGFRANVFNDLPDNYFDLVICNDVIEHMVDHHLFYNKIKVKCVKDDSFPFLTRKR